MFIQHLLALTVGLGSFALYMTAFFFPELYRRNDLSWSGVGILYALVLWFCASQITGGLLLGQTAGVALLAWLGWQNLTLRYAITPAEQQTPLPDSITAAITWVNHRVEWIQAKLQDEELQAKFKGVFTKGTDLVQKTLNASETSEAAAQIPAVDQGESTSQATEPGAEAETETEAEAEADIPPTATDAVGSKLTMAKDWVQGIFASLTQSKPEQPIVEIPPRAPSIPAKPEAETEIEADIIDDETSTVAVTALTEPETTAPPTQVETTTSPAADQVNKSVGSAFKAEDTTAATEISSKAESTADKAETGTGTGTGTETEESAVDTEQPTESAQAEE
ncbi:MAG: hypothetical protein F6K19_43900 [Cyanothece sp. SIO1E1]|nr:hypothetical protein [Cyanothece sp. SIO1E1]